MLGSQLQGKKIWIGGNDLAKRNEWVWGSTGYRIYPYVNWLDGHPVVSESEMSDASCTLLDPENDFQWISESCGNIAETKHYFFCEIYDSRQVKF